MSPLVVDTHAAVWYFLQSKKLSQAALAALDEASRAGEPIYIPSICIVEVVYLVEKGRLPRVALERLTNALADPNSSFILCPLDLAVAQAVEGIPREAVPDMPDRIIAATAFQRSLPLVTRDSNIQAANITTIW